MIDESKYVDEKDCTNSHKMWQLRLLSISIVLHGKNVRTLYTNTLNTHINTLNKTLIFKSALILIHIIILNQPLITHQPCPYLVEHVTLHIRVRL